MGQYRAIAYFKGLFADKRLSFSFFARRMGMPSTVPHHGKKKNPASCQSCRVFFKLPGQDSNLDKENQNQTVFGCMSHGSNTFRNDGSAPCTRLAPSGRFLLWRGVAAPPRWIN
jgi:hypothetical protein